MHLEPGIVLVGLIAGTFIGISGVGGGSLTTPLLIILAGIKPLIAVGTDLVYSVPTKLLGASIHRGQKTVDGAVVRALCWGGIPGALAGVAVLVFARRALPLGVLDASIRHGVGIALFVSAIALVATPFFRRTIEPGAPDVRRSAPRLIAIGAIVGFIVSLTSIGSGSLTLPLLYAVLPLIALRVLVGSDVAFAAWLIPVAALGHLAIGSVDWHLCLNLLIGSMPGVYLGARFCRSIPDSLLRPTVATILIFAGTRLI
jgi:uncharacterized membrane protein YfcA